MQDISLHILDLLQNSISAGASLITVTFKDGVSKPGTKCSLFIEIIDNGRGMDEETLNKVSDPFYTTRTTRRVGLGIPLFKASAEACGGYVEIDSKEGEGTVIQAGFDTGNIDCLPIGSMEDTIAVLLLSNPNVDIIYTHEYKTEKFVFNSLQIKEQLEGLSIGHPDIICWIKEYIKSGLNEIYGGA